MVRTIDLRKVYTPTPRQVEAHTASERYILYGGAVGGGKSTWLCTEGLRLSLDYPGNVGYLCRHELSSFMRTTMLTLERFLPRDLVAQHHQTENFFRLKRGSLIFYGGLGDDERAIERLKSMELGWFGIDQAEETSESHFFMLASRLRLKVPDILYRGLMTANPAPGWVKYRFIEQKLDDHRFVPALPKDNPYLPPDYEPGLRKLYPADLVKSLLDGDWNVLEAGKYLFNYGDLRNAIERKFYTGTWVRGEEDSEIDEDALGRGGEDSEPEEDDFDGEPVVIGIDIAAEGTDESVSVVRRGKKVIWLEGWSYDSTMATTGKIITLIERFKPSVVNLDAIGIGKGVHDRLAELNIKHNGIVAGEKANDKEHYINQRAEMYFDLKNLFEQGQISIPNNLDLVAQLSSIRWDYESDKRLKLVSKDEMRRRFNVKSPDKADALALAFMQVPRREYKITWI